MTTPKIKRSLSDAVKQKISKKEISESTKEKISKALIGREMPDDVREKLSEAAIRRIEREWGPRRKIFLR